MQQSCACCLSTWHAPQHVHEAWRDGAASGRSTHTSGQYWPNANRLASRPCAEIKVHHRPRHAEDFVWHGLTCLTTAALLVLLLHAPFAVAAGFSAAAAGGTV